MAGILSAALVGVYVEYQRDHWVPPARWVGLTLYTVFGFGVIANDFRRHWRQARFWLYIGSLLTGHLIGYVVLLVAIDEWRLIWFLPLSLMEFPVIAHAMDVAMGRYDHLEPKRMKRRFFRIR